MKRPIYAYVCYGAALAIILAISALPTSSWSFKNHLDILSGGWKSSTTGSDYVAWVEPVRLTGTSRSFLEPPIYGTYPWNPDFASYVSNAHAHPNDPASLAHLVRQCRPGMGGEDILTIKPPSSFWNGKDVHQITADCLWAAERGSKIDADNGFFWIMQGALLDWAGKTQGAYECVEKAGKCSKWEDYAVNEGMDRYNLMLSRYGYRGEKPKAEILGAILLPHYSIIKQYARSLKHRPADRDVVGAEANLIRVADLMMRRSSSSIGVLVGGSLVNAILLPERKTAHGRTDPPLDKNLLPHVAVFNQLEKKVGVVDSVDPTHLANLTMRLRDEDWFAGLADPFAPGFSQTGTVPAPALLYAIVMCVGLACLTFLVTPGNEKLRSLMPYACAITSAWLIDANASSDFFKRMSFEYWQPIPNDAGVFVLIATGLTIMFAVVQLFKPIKRPVTFMAIACSIVVAGLGIFVDNAQLAYYMPAFVFLIALLVNRITVRVPYVVTTMLAFIFCLGAGILTTLVIIGGHTDWFLAHLLTLFSLGCVVILANGSRKLVAVAPAITLLFSVGYLGFTIREIRVNEQLKVALASWNDEAKILRAKTGIQ